MKVLALVLIIAALAKCDYIVSTVAGSGTAGFTDGTGSIAEFQSPYDVTISSDGHVYVADCNNNRVRVISPSGVVSTLAGNGVAGYSDGYGTVAQFSCPFGIAVSSDGHVYVADYGNNRIRVINPINGYVSTYAGSGLVGYADGTASTARFNGTYNVAVSFDGHVYVADYGNNLIRVINTNGIVWTLAGSRVPGFVDGSAASAKFYGPTDVEVSSDGHVYVCEWDNNRVRVISPSGIVSTLAGNGVAGYLDGTGSSAKFNGLTGITVSSDGHVYVAEWINNRVRVISPFGVVSTLAGTGSPGYLDGSGSIAQFNSVSGVEINSNGDVYVADAMNNMIRLIKYSSPTSTSSPNVVSSSSSSSSLVVTIIIICVSLALILLLAVICMMRRKKSKITPKKLAKFDSFTANEIETFSFVDFEARNWEITPIDYLELKKELRNRRK